MCHLQISSTAVKLPVSPSAALFMLILPHILSKSYGGLPGNLIEVAVVVFPWLHYSDLMKRKEASHHLLSS